MNASIVQQASPVNPFDSIRRARPDGSEFWSARELMPLLGYDKWERFSDALERAKAACDNSGQNSRDQFPGAGKMISAGKGSQREVLDYHLTRYACYLTAMNGDARKTEIADAQLYFATQTRRAEIEQERPVSALALSRAMLEALEQQDTRLSAVESRFDNLPVTGAAKGEIHARVTRLALLMGGKPSDYSAAWRAFKNRYGLAAYGDLPSRSQPEAVRFVDGLIAAYSPANMLLEVTV